MTSGNTIYQNTGADGFFDGFGRVKQAVQTIDGVAYAFSFGYNLGGWNHLDDHAIRAGGEHIP